MYDLVKLILTVGLVVLVSETAKRSTLLGGLAASLPLVSLLAIVWVYVETGDPSRVASLSRSIFWLVLPSLSLFVTLPALLKAHVSFYPALALSLGIMLGCYGIMLAILNQAGIRL